MNVRKLTIVTKKQIIKSLREQMPDAPPDMIESFAAQICDNADIVSLDQLLLHVFVNMPLALTVPEGDSA